MTALMPVSAVTAGTARRIPRLLAGLGHPPGLSGHERAYGPLHVPLRRPGRLIDVVEASGLTGRGGAGYPAGRKMRAVAAGPGRKAVVANGAEGEPASHKDRLLLTRLPHLVLDGIALAAQAVGADEAYLCVHGTDGALLGHLDRAVAEREAAGRDPVPIQVTGIPGRYVSSEQSSIVQYLNGGPGKPTFSPPRPHERGVHGKPTLVHNVETLAHLALIARRGDHWFRGAGLPSAPGTMLVTVSGAVRRPGVYEIEMGTTAGEVIALAGGPAKSPAGFAGRRLLRRLAAGRDGLADAADPRGAAGGGRLARGGHRRRPAGRCLPASRDGPRGPLPGRGERRPVRPVPVRPACAGRRAGRPGLLRGQGGGHRRHRGAAAAGRAARSLPSPRRGHAAGAQHAHRVRGGRALASVAGGLCRCAPSAPAAAARRRGKGLGLGMSVTLRINPIACTGHGMCAELLPEVIGLDRWGYPVLVSPAIPRSLLDHARRAAQACPRLALLVEEKAGKHR